MTGDRDSHVGVMPTYIIGKEVERSVVSKHGLCDVDSLTLRFLQQLLNVKVKPWTSWPATENRNAEWPTCITGNLGSGKELLWFVCSFTDSAVPVVGCSCSTKFSPQTEHSHSSNQSWYLCCSQWLQHQAHNLSDREHRRKMSNSYFFDTLLNHVLT